MPNIRHILVISAPPEKVYDAITTQEGLSGWWCTKTKAEPRPDSIARFEFDEGYHKEMKITELQPSKKVAWLCQVAYPEWIGTTVTFEMEPHANGTLLSFYHDGWKEYTKEFAVCNYHWALFMRSLRLLCETGKGLPAPKQLQ